MSFSPSHTAPRGRLRESFERKEERQIGQLTGLPLKHNTDVSCSSLPVYLHSWCFHRKVCSTKSVRYDDTTIHPPLPHTSRHNIKNVPLHRCWLSNPHYYHRLCVPFLRREPATNIFPASMPPIVPTFSPTSQFGYNFYRQPVPPGRGRMFPCGEDEFQLVPATPIV